MQFFPLLLFLFSYVETRGPHHPVDSVSHHHYHPQPKGDMLLKDSELLHDKRHITEDLGEWAENLSLSDEEAEFRYFKIHDFDDNIKLDGLEIFQAIKHSIDSVPKEDIHYSHLKNEDAIIKLIDAVLKEDDIDNDGYLTYTEFKIARAKEKNKNNHQKI